mgnify:FL=1
MLLNRIMVTACVVLFSISNAIAQTKPGGCMKEPPPVHSGIGFPMTAPVLRTFCAPPNGTILIDERNQLVCALGERIEDDDGRVFCSRVAGGSAIIDDDGGLKCVGGCIKGSVAITRWGRARC